MTKNHRYRPIALDSTKTFVAEGFPAFDLVRWVVTEWHQLIGGKGTKLGTVNRTALRCELKRERWFQCEAATVWRSFWLECARDARREIWRTNHVHRALWGSHRPILRPASTGSKNVAAWA